MTVVLANSFGGHARRYKPAMHHANLIANPALTLCSFVFDSFEYQKARGREA